MIPKERDSEVVVRVLLSCASIVIGTALWFTGATLFNGIDRQPASASDNVGHIAQFIACAMPFG